MVGAAALTVVALLLGCDGEGAAPAPALEVARGDLSFGEVARGHPVTLQLDVWNAGSAVLHVDSVWVDDEQFTVDTTLPVLTGLGPGEGAVIQVTLDPAADGACTAILHIESDDPSTPVRQIGLSGTGISSDLRVEPGSSLEFGTATVGEMLDETITVVSVGEASLSVGEIALAEGEGAFWILAPGVGPDSIVLQPGTELVISVAYMPAVSGDAENTLVIASDDPDSPLVEIRLHGEAAESAPLCSILQPSSAALYEGETVVLEASAVDGQTAGQDLLVRWIDELEGVETTLYSGGTDDVGLVTLEHAPEGVGSHTLRLEVEDQAGLRCQDAVVLQVLEDEPPEVTLTAPASAQVEHGECLVFNGVVSDQRDGRVLAVEWTSDHPDAPVPLDAGWSDGDGLTTLEICSLPCGSQQITLTAWDVSGQATADSESVEVTLADPVLTEIPSRDIVLGQTLSVTLEARRSCGVAPTITVTGLPPDAVLTADGFDWTPLFDPADNPIGQQVAIDVHAEIEHDGAVRTDDAGFTIGVVSDEFLALSGEDPAEVRLLYNEYDGGVAAPEILSMGLAMEPVAAADFNGDGAVDLLLRDAVLTGWLLVRQDDGTFLDVQLPLYIDGPVAVGDHDGDGRPDLVVLDDLLGGTTYLNVTADPAAPAFAAVPGSVNLSTLARPGNRVLASSAVDWDGDGLDDLVFAFSDAEDTAVILALASAAADGTFDTPVPWLLTDPLRGMAQGLYGDDAEPDLIIGGAEVGDAGQAWLLPGDGALGLGEAVAAWDANPAVETVDEGDEAAGASVLAPMDLDHDGCSDVVVSFISYLDPSGISSDQSVGMILQRTESGTGRCLGIFASGSGEDLPDVAIIVDEDARVVVPHVP